MRFVYDGMPWLLDARVPKWQGDTSGMGSALPDGAVAVVSSDVKARCFRLFCWTPDQGDFAMEVPFDAVQRGAGMVYPTGRLDPLGTPVITLHGGMIKLWVRLWDGGSGKGAPLARIYTWVYLT